jgi:hypothetical protein
MAQPKGFSGDCRFNSQDNAFVDKSRRIVAAVISVVRRGPILTNARSKTAKQRTETPTTKTWKEKLKSNLWWGLLAVAVAATAGFFAAVFWYHPAPTTRERALLLIGGASIVAWIGLGLWKIPQWQARNAPEEEGKSEFDIENEARNTLGEIVSGLGVVAGLLFTWYQISDTRNATERSLQTTQQGQITARFTQAIDQLGNDKVDVRVGGIYSLERIAQDAPNEFYRPVMEVLAGYVHEHNRYVQPLAGSASQLSNAPSNGQALDSWAAVIVIGRRSDPPANTGELQLNLAGTDLRSMPLAGANLEGVDLTGAHLEGADLTGADLNGATLNSVVATGLVPTKFKNACLKHARLLSSDISPGQIEAAITDKTTVLPDGSNAPVDEEGCG